ncbi:MAG: hypothetical protein WAL72_07705 [Streptosporangiaceae bacterium]
MGIDRRDDADVPSNNPADRTPAAANDAQRSAVSHVETRYREEYYSARTQVAQEERATTGAQQETPAPDTWTETANLAHWMWGEYHRRWPPEERPPVDRSTDPPGSWRSDSNRYLDSSTNARIEAECDRIVEREQEKITPAMQDIESQDPDRHLAGFQHRLKGRDRIKEKVYGMIQESGFSAEEAVSRVPDAIRYTLQYDEAHYTQSVRADIARMREQGFKLDALKNSWSDDQYKGINSQWTESDANQRFEVQFHTHISFEAKQLTHGSYERLRAGQPDKFEQMVLEAFQKKVSAEVPIPPGAADIAEFPKRDEDAR